MQVSKQPFNTKYLVKQTKKELEAQLGGTKWERACIWLKNQQGETLNNTVTAVGTSAVAPIFIIHNPLANEDMDTKKYTAARQPISALITLAAQIPIMNAYNNWVDKMAVKHHFDKCDLAAAPTTSYLKEGMIQDYKDFLYKKSINDPEALAIEKKCVNKKGKLSKSKVKEYFYKERKNQAFYDELKFLRESVRKNDLAASLGKAAEADYIPEYLKKSIKKNGLIRVEDLISRNDIKDAGRTLIHDYLKKTFSLPDIAALKLPPNVSIDTMDSFSEIKVKKALKDASIKFTKEHKKALKEIIKNEAAPLARKNVTTHLIQEARLKLYTHKVYMGAKEEMAEYRRQLTLANTPKAEQVKLLAKKDIEILTNLKKQAQALAGTASESLPKNMNLRKLTIDNIVPTKGELETFIAKIDDKLQSTRPRERYIKYLRTSEGTTFKELFRSVQLKRWLKARINNSQNYLSDFKQKSGIIVGLAILPFTCGLLNWAYPRIMEEWFPHLANAKKASKEAKEAK